jgi:predicted ester cyclase
MSERVQRLEQAFANGNAGDRRAAMVDFHPEYVHHSNLLGEIQGLDTYFEKWLPLFESLNFKQQIEHITEHPPFVVVAVRQTSSLKPDETSALHIYRWDDDQIVELWSLTDPS